MIAAASARSSLVVTIHYTALVSEVFYHRGLAGGDYRYCLDLGWIWVGYIQIDVLEPFDPPGSDIGGLWNNPK